AAIAVEAHQRTAFGTAARGAVHRLRVLHAKVAGAVPGATDPQRTLQHEGAVVGVVIVGGEVEVGRDHLHDHERTMRVIAEIESRETEELLGQLGLVDREADPSASLRYVEIGGDRHVFLLRFDGANLRHADDPRCSAKNANTLAHPSTACSARYIAGR